MANGYKILVEHNIYHRDIKPENIFVSDKRDASFHAKIEDFGHGKILDQESGSAHTALGTYTYMAQEILITIGQVTSHYSEFFKHPFVLQHNGK